MKTMMNAAVVTAFAEPPRYQPFAVPMARDGEILVDVLAAGQHYTSSGMLPLIAGVDGVGRRPDGKLVYFAADDDALGTMADKAIVDPLADIERAWTTKENPGERTVLMP